MRNQLQTLRTYQLKLGLVTGTLWTVMRSAGYRGFAPSEVTVRPKVLSMA